jgi:maltose-binding protein MalE
MHCKLSPLAHVSQHFIDYHPNPYIQVFEDIAASPDSFSVPQIPIWEELADELNVASQKCYLLEQTPEQALRDASARVQAKWNYFRSIQEARGR